jgi:ATP-dependent RNA helicase DHX37/DHR1
LSAALPLRRKAALEGSLPPLKLVLMSATLRVEDFTGSGKLFIEDPPNVVRVPGRTFPVTIHHSKTTELDDYEKIAFQKVCKIHRKLPEGGILVFLTGKQEIVRMVKRLRKSLVPKSEHRKEMSSETDVEIQLESDFAASSGPRDLDDDEADGDLFQMNDNDDYDEAMEDNDTSIDKTIEAIENEDDEDNIPKKVKILPLYSLLSVKDQAKVFAPVEKGTRLIVVSTNIAETSLTIPGISYVVDTGRQKCRNYHAQTGVASYDVMWISKASADQRAGRAGRTGPGHCYRTFSSSVYSRHLDDYALPEMLSRPLEDVVLAMKSMSISNVAEFPFPTSPNPSQLEAAVQLLANIGCVNVSNVERDGGDGVITRLGAAISQLPVGVRYGKMLLIAAQANVLDYGIVMVSVLSESSPFSKTQEDVNSDESDTDSNNSMEGLDGVDRTNAIKQERRKRKQRKNLWRHDGGDVLAGMLATGAYSYAGRGSGGASENFACRKFCEENNLNPVIMQRIQKMRIHLAKLSKQRLGNATGVAASGGRILSSMSPPKKLEESLLKQVCFIL